MATESPQAPAESVPVTLATPVTSGEADRKSIAGTEALALKAAGQREINLIWELTQQKIALGVMGSALLVSTILGVGGANLGVPEAVQLAAIVFLFGAANLVAGFYFGRTNHQRTGGVGGDIAGTR